MRSNNELLYSFAKQVTPNGSQTLSKMPNRYAPGYPKIIESGKGPFLIDVDGRKYVDYIAGLGPIILGYANSVVDSAVIKQMEKGVLFSMSSILEGEVAAELGKLVPYPTMWKFTKTGSDACTTAVKIAKAYTNRDNVVVCGYHGWHDWFSIVNDKKAGITRVLDTYVKKARYNTIQDFERLIDENTACVIMEPQIFDAPQPGFLETVKELCHQHGALFILDETVTGFRYPGMLAQNHYRVYADLTIVGKAMANGYPMAAVGGRTEVMKTCERDDFFISTTFGGDCVGLAACQAVLKELPKHLDNLMVYGESLKSIFNDAFEGKVACKGFATRTMFDFPSTAHKALFWQECCKRGILFGYSNFVMAAHLDLPVQEATYRAIKEAAQITLANWNNPESKVEGELPVEVFRLLRS